MRPQISLILIPCAVLSACGGKKGSGGAFGPNLAGVLSETTSTATATNTASDQQGSQSPAESIVTTEVTPLRQFTTIVGRTIGKRGSAESTTPLAGVHLYAFVDGKMVSADSNQDGFFSFKDVPVISQLSAGINLNIYTEIDGWELATDDEHDIVDFFSVDVRSGTETTTGYQIDVGQVVFKNPKLKVTSSLFHPSTRLTSPWLLSGQSTSAGYNPEVYLADASASISLSFNWPIDTKYSTGTSENPLIEFYDPAGAPVAFVGSWDKTNTVYTIDPSDDLIADHDDETNYRIRIARPVRALIGPSGAMEELRNVDIVFNVLASGALDLLASQAPSLAPAEDGFTGYVFDSSLVHRRAIQTGTTVVDYTTDATNFKIKWSAVAGARSYDVYWRNRANQKSGAWTKHNTTDITALSSFSRADGTFVYTVSDAYSTDLAGADGKLLAGEQLEFVVTATDVDGNESSINDVESPLVIKDEFGPTISSIVNNSESQAISRAEGLQTTVTRRVTLTFSELMDTVEGAAPTLALISGLTKNLQVSNKLWTSRSVWQADLKMEYPEPRTKLLQIASAGQNILRPDFGLDTFRFFIGDIILLKTLDATDPDAWETRTISEISSVTGEIKLSSNLTYSYPVDTPVFLVKNSLIAGMTAVRANTTSVLLSGATDVPITTGRGDRFNKGQEVRFFAADQGGYIVLGTATLLSVSANALKLTAPLSFEVPLGSLIVDSSITTAAEPSPRAEISFAAKSNVSFSVNNVVTTALVNNFTANPDVAAQRDTVLVTNTDGFAPNDVVVIQGSTYVGTTTQDQADPRTVVPMTGHNFLVGDEVLIEGERIVNGLSANVTNSTTVNLDNNIRVTAGESVVIVDEEIVRALTAAAAAGETSLQVDNATGIVQGMTVILDDGVQTPTSITVNAVTANTLTVDALASSWPSGTRVVRQTIQDTKAIASDSTATTITLANAGTYSGLANLIVTRASETRTVTATTANDFTLSSALSSPKRRLGTKVRLNSHTETATIATVDKARSELIFTANLSYPHRATAQINKSPQAWVSMNSTNWNLIKNSILIGDTVIVDALAAGGSLAHQDRFATTVAAIDSPNLRIKLSTARTTILPSASASFTLMGDAIRVSEATDTNGNKLQLFLNRFSLGSTTIR